MKQSTFPMTEVSLEFLEFNLHTFGWLITSYSSDSELFKLVILEFPFKDYLSFLLALDAA